jgi:hypothetical protein
MVPKRSKSAPHVQSALHQARFFSTSYTLTEG